MIDIQMSVELSYAIAVLLCVSNYALTAFWFVQVGHWLTKDQKWSAVGALIFAVPSGLFGMSFLWNVARWYAQLAELRGW